ncbi:beta-1,4-galactosyltransferase 3-like [Hemicordylus capensis]|uniref:beta-1,4-galactosyltransferase 3-like n=1 Tax=Hemicordylus capensis TaxID=884348 RepID=UPI0023042D53|nr:beta-1,4-galactosyltransferase 3-like [Hemicordylus capensis]XP_053165871.1 beta-1,4-galactosyltransferase 3-like [Hemicordylus capensis]XP_053165872.1 beta-1,4-galactosyltransferase 3-like [Hemicordylus capensis]XP_053165873.1 beta-1,4-galactosyltransferase 3-like [Hemicordylus capensis]XP_053165876.1 beta-1,4-galactosyltransferase 3-like [Hemicordylus capensis]
MELSEDARSLVQLPNKNICCHCYFTVPMTLKHWDVLKNKKISKAIHKTWLLGGKMSLSRVENPCFLLFLFIFQAVFILILYRGGASSVLQRFLDGPLPLDYSKTEDVYTNLSLFTRAPDKGTMPSCTLRSPIFVGPLTITFDMLPSERTIIDKNPYVQLGGHYSPPHCLARYKIAIIVPHRNREKHLRHFLYYVHPFLQRQQLHYCIYLIHQAGSGPFNRAKLLNIGVREAMKDNDWDCLFLHNVNLIPENDYNLYICDQYYPKHMSSAIDKLQYSLPHWSFFGGVSALTPENYMKMNGFPNTYWDHGGEDDDIAERIRLAGLKIVRTPIFLGRYKRMDYGHISDQTEKLQRIVVHTRNTWKDDGMNSLEFKVLAKKKYPLYTNITVDIGGVSILPPEGKRNGSKA